MTIGMASRPKAPDLQGSQRHGSIPTLLFPHLFPHNGREQAKYQEMDWETDRPKDRKMSTFLRPNDTH
jgi:hypothetical protein